MAKNACLKLRPNHNCWKTAQADRVSVLIDGEAYYKALYEAVQQAQQAVYVLAWDIDSRMQLVYGEDIGEYPATLGELFHAVLKKRPELHIYLLNWDWAMLYTLEREWLPIFRPDWKKQKRLHYELDGACPFGGSQHQKLVVIDDVLAFCGGIDLGKHRWDTPAHAPDDPRRIDPEGLAYPPFHDLMMMVDGELARCLGQLARERWQQAMQQTLPPPRKAAHRLWPTQIPVDFEKVDIAISRTLPEYQGRDEIREIEAFYLDAIASAQHCIYIENQYFTSYRVAQALAERLTEPDGPEVIIICPAQTGGWLEQHTMDVLRQRVCQTLTDADAHHHLRICYPHDDALGAQPISLHSKLIIVDDRVLHIGSANLSNRSMGLDSECDLTLVAESETQQQQITRIRQRLLCEHLALSSADYQQAVSQHRSVLQLIDARVQQPKTLRWLDCSLDAVADDLLPTADYIDPERPVDSVVMSRKLIPIDVPRSPKKQIAIAGLVLIVVLILTAAWQWTPLNDWLSVDRLREIVAIVDAYPLAPVLIIAGFAVAALLAVPLTLLIIVIGLTFGAWPGSFYALGGALLSAMMGYGAGHLLGRRSVVRLAGSRLNKLSRRLAEHGVMAIITVRLIPVAPFTVINLVAGATHIKLRDFVIGTLIGMSPGIVAITVFTQSLRQLLSAPSAWGLAVFVGVILALAGVLWRTKKWIEKLAEKRGSP